MNQPGSCKYVHNKKGTEEDLELSIRGVPHRTNESDIEELLKSWVPEYNGVVKVDFNFPKNTKRTQISTGTAIVLLHNNKDRDFIMAHFYQIKGKHGMFYVNSCGYSSNINVACVHTNVNNNKRKSVAVKNDEKKEDKFHAINNITSSSEYFLDVEDKELLFKLAVEKDTWMKEKQITVKYIKLLEETLKEKCPEFFVSEIELQDLRRTKEALDEQINVRKVKVSIAKDDFVDFNKQFKTSSFTNV